MKDEYNSSWQELKFDLTKFSQRFVWNDNEIRSIRLKFSIPYIKDLSRELKYSYGLYPEWLYKFGNKPFTLDINNQLIEFEEKVYCYEYKEPDSILARELFVRVNLSRESQVIEKLLGEYKSIVNDIMLIVSFLFNHRMSPYSFTAELLDEHGKLVESSDFKESKKLCGADCLMESSENFKKYLSSINVSKLIENFINKEPKEKRSITILVNKFLTLGETKIFEPKFLSGYFLLEAVSKFIVNPKNIIDSEKLIEDAVVKSEVSKEDFKMSHKRRADPKSKLQFEITEYRNYLTHFNHQDTYDGQVMFEEYLKIVRLCRKLILWTICPELSLWPLPK